jgi:Asp-tRNA(Asn)/Glu-tRNA(Gln) amidotransferase A subunit family amidase
VLWDDGGGLIAPATPAPAPRIGQTTVLLGGEEEDVRLAATRFARGINVVGLPAVSIPCGLTAAGLPAGAQIVGPAFGEAAIVRVATALEDAGAGVPPCPFR